MIITFLKIILVLFSIFVIFNLIKSYHYYKTHANFFGVMIKIEDIDKIIDEIRDELAKTYNDKCFDIYKIEKIDFLNATNKVFSKYNVRQLDGSDVNWDAFKKEK